MERPRKAGEGALLQAKQKLSSVASARYLTVSSASHRPRPLFIRTTPLLVLVDSTFVRLTYHTHLDNAHHHDPAFLCRHQRSGLLHLPLRLVFRGEAQGRPPNRDYLWQEQVLGDPQKCVLILAFMVHRHS